MPIYEFKCKKCGNEFEYLCFNSRDEEEAECPKCGSKETAKLLSSFSSVSSGGSLATASSCVPSGGFS
ncbi:MAG: zinc ribbon domain-containing protein [Deltaproteobacteria bacterium]|nr:zinc ribbon domain-containing protein [Deltaproteobacteria bacterium]